MLERLPEYSFGLTLDRAWTAGEVLDVMARRCGVDPDPEHVEGQDTIGVDLALAALDAYRDRLALAAERRERVLVATGHPTGLLAVHLAVAAALRAAGCEVLVVDPPWSLAVGAGLGPRPAAARPRRQRGAPAGQRRRAAAHPPRREPMRAVLAALAGTGSRRPTWCTPTTAGPAPPPRPGSRRWATPTATTPPCSWGRTEGRPLVTVPLDDNVPPHLYDPLSAHVTRGRRVVASRGWPDGPLVPSPTRTSTLRGTCVTVVDGGEAADRAACRRWVLRTCPESCPTSAS